MAGIQPQGIASRRDGRHRAGHDPRSSERTAASPDPASGRSEESGSTPGLLTRRDAPCDRIPDSSGGYSTGRGLGHRLGAAAGRLSWPKGRHRCSLPSKRPVAGPRGRHDAEDLASGSAERARGAGRPHGRGLVGGLFSRRDRTGHRQRRYPGKADDPALGPGFRPARGGLEGAYRDRFGPGLQPGREDAGLGQPGFGQGGKSQRDPLGRDDSSTIDEP